MKKWQSLFLCLLINSCDLDKDKQQKPVDNTIVQNIHESTCINFSVLDALREIGQELNYPGFKEERENLNFFCDCSKNNIDDKKKKIVEILQRPLNDTRLFKENNDSTIKQMLVKRSDETAKNSLQLLGLDSEISEDSDLITVLSTVIFCFLEKSILFFEKLDENLKNYQPKVGSEEKLGYSVQAFQKLSVDLKAFLEEFTKLVKREKDINGATKLQILHVIFLFFNVILPQLYNVYYNNIFRVKLQDGVVCKDLSLVDAIR